MNKEKKYIYFGYILVILILQKMRKYTSDVSVTKNCIDANLEMFERRVPDNFPCFPPQEWCVWTIPEIALKRISYIDKETCRTW